MAGRLITPGSLSARNWLDTRGVCSIIYGKFRVHRATVKWDLIMNIRIFVSGPEGHRLTVNGVLKARPLSPSGNPYMVKVGENTFVAKGPNGQTRTRQRTLAQSDAGITIQM